MLTLLLYKAAVRDLHGDQILPLSSIRDRYPELYQREAAKYADYPHVMDIPVHPLGCRWSDVLFFSPVHPTVIFDALAESGRIKSGPSYWTLDADLLDPDKTCILLKRHDPHHRAQPAEDYLPYTADAVAALATPPPEALARLRRLTPTEPLFPWRDIPHVLHRGPIPVSWFRTATGDPVHGAKGGEA
ncbi:hypothetical protein EV138_4104 [Kribbella voronezhensis]|uniref:Uncharacterized protein n=1 Tax=Kribbella voronezhensis TaxID=2512212 RepID=A0A4V3FKK2_9ACTN|nr:hypothetical protein [Kribbella voronezhensis]TDU90513.1 hypothetical protein EV138_4104 [Kribbella voronezhensis]